MNNSRYEDWPERLAAFIESRFAVPFKWGQNDCALFACDAVKEMTGFDPGHDFRGKYKTAKGSLSALKKYGDGDLDKTATMIMGNPLQSPRFSQRGDMVLMPSDLGPQLGICLGETAAVVCVDGGVVFKNMHDALKAWRV